MARRRWQWQASGHAWDGTRAVCSSESRSSSSLLAHLGNLSAKGGRGGSVPEPVRQRMVEAGPVPRLADYSSMPKDLNRATIQPEHLFLARGLGVGMLIPRLLEPWALVRRVLPVTLVALQAAAAGSRARNGRHGRGGRRRSDAGTAAAAVTARAHQAADTGTTWRRRQTASGYTTTNRRIESPAATPRYPAGRIDAPATGTHAI